MVLYFKNLSSNSLKPDFRCFLLVILFLSQVSSVWSSDNGLGIGFGRGHFDSAIHKTYSNSKFVKIKKKVLVENQFSARNWNLQRKQNIVDGVTTDVLANDNSSSNNSGNQESNSNNGRIGGNNGGGGSNNTSGSGGGSNQSLVSNAQPTTTGSSSSSSTSSSSTSSSVTTTSSSSTETTTTVATTSDPGATTTTTGAASTTETSSPPSSLSYSLTSTPTITSTGNPFLSNDPINAPNPTTSVPAQSPSSISTSSSNDKSFFSRVFDKSNKLFPIAITVCVVGGIITILLGLGLLQCIIRSSFLRSEAKQEKKKLAQQPKTEDFLADIIARPPAGRIRNDNEQSIVSYGNMGRGTRIERVGEMRERERVGDDGRRIALGGATGPRNYMRMPEAPAEPFDSSRADPFVRPPPSPVPYQTPRQLPLPDPRNFTNPSQTSFDPRGRPSNRQFIPQTTPQRQSQQLNQVQRGFVPQGRPQPQFQPQIQPRLQFQPEVQSRPQFQPEVQPRSQFQPQVQPQAPLVQPQMYRGLQRDGTITYKPPPKKQISRNSTFIFPDTPPPPQAQLPSNFSNPYREADDNNRREFLYNYYYRTSSSSYGHRKSLSQKTASSGSFYQTSDPRSSSDNVNRSFSIGVAEGGEEEVEDGGDPPMDRRRESQIRVKELNKKVRKGTLKKSR